MPSIRALVVAAGRGTRAGLPYPKTLFPIQGTPILIRIVTLLRPYDKQPTVVVSPLGEAEVARCLEEHGVTAELVKQFEPRGMGDAVLQFRASSAFSEAEHVLLIWGDIPFIQPDTVSTLVRAHLRNQNDFTLATRVVDKAYTIVTRDREGAVCSVDETRELGALGQSAGERDIGLFIFRTAPVLDALQEDLPGRLGTTTGEHGFLYVIRHLVKRGYRVEALPVATELDLVSLNSLKDVDAFL